MAQYEKFSVTCKNCQKEQHKKCNPGRNEICTCAERGHINE